MAKLAELTLLGLHCEFSRPGESLKVAASLAAHTFDQPAVIATTKVLLGDSDGLFTFTEGQTLAIDKAVRFAFSTPSVDDPTIGNLFVRFGGTITEKFQGGSEARIGEDSITLGTRDVIDSTLIPFHLYFGRSALVVRADFTINIVQFF